MLLNLLYSVIIGHNFNLIDFFSSSVALMPRCVIKVNLISMVGHVSLGGQAGRVIMADAFESEHLDYA